MTTAQHWATRCQHEAKMHPENCFLTLSYSDEKLPRDLGLSKRELQLFLKRLRKSIEPKQVRFFACGEYSPKTLRPHYHMILFGHSFMDDRKLARRSQSGHLLYKSQTLDDIWGLGYCWIGHVTHQSAGYVARYALKKSTVGPDKGERFDPDTGETWMVQPEFQLMSLKPGIGAGWFDKFASDAFPSDFVVIDGKKTPIPPYYRRRLNGNSDALIPPSFAVDRKRAIEASKRAGDTTTERRLVKDEINHRRNRLLIRGTDT